MVALETEIQSTVEHSHHDGHGNITGPYPGNLEDCPAAEIRHYREKAELTESRDYWQRQFEAAQQTITAVCRRAERAENKLLQIMKIIERQE